jgi:hypothetical protein
MSVGEIAQLITSVATLIGVLRVTRQVTDVHKATNGIVEKLVQSTATASEAEGRAAGLKQGRSEKP